MIGLSDDKQQRSLDIHTQSVFIQLMDTTWPKMFNEEYLGHLKTSGVTALGINGTWKSGLPRNLRQALEDIYVWHRVIKDLNLRLITTAEDIRKAKREGEIAVMKGWQNIEGIESDLRLLTIFHQLGIRMIGLAYQKRNLVADGCGDHSHIHHFINVKYFR